MGGPMHNEVPPPPNIRGRGRGGNIRGRGRGRGFGGTNHGGGYMNAGEGPPFPCHLLAYSRNDCVPFLGRHRGGACLPCSLSLLFQVLDMETMGTAAIRPQQATVSALSVSALGKLRQHSLGLIRVGCLPQHL